jgi:tRNA threonylcarbamoyladenosine biosynthesis protein TsaB
LLTLGIETSGRTASVALIEDGIMLGQSSLLTAKTHSQVILPMVKKLIFDCDKEIGSIDKIAVGIGPGSYTGIRIGVAAVKAMSFSLGIECCGVSTLEGLAYNFPSDGLVCSVMKARQNLVYTALFRFSDNKAHRILDDMLIEDGRLSEMLSEYGEQIVMTGDGAEEFSEKFGNGCIKLSPMHLRHQNAAGICLASLNHDYCRPEMLEASYLQLVKAEKDLINAERR